MQIEALLAESLELLVLGMGSVFLLLSMMVLLVQATSRLLTRWAPEDALPPPSRQTSHTDADGEDPNGLIAVIQAAVQRYRSRT